MQSKALSLVIAALGASLATPAFADTVVTSIPEWNGLTGFNQAGTGVQIVGQTFTVPQGVVTLDSIRTPISMAFSLTGARAYVFAVTGNHATGSPLFRSDPITAPNTSAFTLLEFTGIGAAVTPGQEYVVLFTNAGSNTTSLTNSNFASPVSASASPLLGRIVAAGFPRTNPDVDVANLTVATLNTILAPRDLAIELTFIPTPGATTLLGLGGLASLRRRRTGS